MSTRYVVVSFLAAALSAFAQPAAADAQSSQRFAAITPRMQEFVDKGEATGIVTLIATKDRILHQSAVGRTDSTTDRKMRADDLFWIASMTKPMVAVCLGMLVDDGKIAFDDPVAKHLPEFRGLTVAQNGGEAATPARSVTIRDVLTHTSGFGELSPREPHLTLAETSKALAQKPLRFQPGNRWAYSTAGIDILGRVVEVVSRMPFDRFLQTRLFDPIGMKNTTFWIDPKEEARWARAYRWDPLESTCRHASLSIL